MTDARASFLAKAREFLSDDSLLVSPEDCSRYASDWTKTPGAPFAVALPRSTAEVSLLLKLCSEFGIPVVPSGGRTGLAGGAVARHAELVMSVERMRHLGPIDRASLTVRVQAGATTASVHEHCRQVGLLWPIDLAAKGTSQIGGNLSTNAGGVRVIRYGMTRKWVVGLQIVTMEGEVIELNQDLEKNNTGYDLVQLICGSEGTLAVITEATLKLTRLPRRSSVFFFPLEDISHIHRLFEEARRGPFEILAFEFFSQACLKVVMERLNRHSRLGASSPFYALLEVELPDEDSVNAKIEAWLESLLKDQIVSDGWIAHSSEEQKEVWGLREGITESLQQTPPVKKYDVSVPVRALVPFLKSVEEVFQKHRYGIDLFLFGHLGDGSPHLNLLKPKAVGLDKFLADCAEFEGMLFELLKKFHGSVSAEHGVGLLKKHWLLFSRTPEELRLFKAIKKAFDPRGLLNPGKVIDL